MSEEIHRVLHILWSKAVGTKGYVKAEWMKLAGLIEEKAMTREEMALLVDEAGERAWGLPSTVSGLRVVAAELRKTCGGCHHFDAEGYADTIMDAEGYCQQIGGVPKDGTGFCHRWEARVIK